MLMTLYYNTDIPRRLWFTASEHKGLWFSSMALIPLSAFKRGLLPDGLANIITDGLCSRVRSLTGVTYWQSRCLNFPGRRKQSHFKASM